MLKIRVLVVDDSVIVRQILYETLSAHPTIEVVGRVSSGHLALAKITQVNPDVIILDVEMPEMDGLEVLRRIRKTHPKLPIIMFSTLTKLGAPATLDALSLGATDYVTKPTAEQGVLVKYFRTNQQKFMQPLLQLGLNNCYNYGHARNCNNECTQPHHAQHRHKYSNHFLASIPFYSS